MCKFPNPANLHLRPSLLSFRNMSLVLSRTWMTNFCSMILKSFQNLFFKLILCLMILKSFQNLFVYPRTWVTLCRVHNMVLDDKFMYHPTPFWEFLYEIAPSWQVYVCQVLVPQKNGDQKPDANDRNEEQRWTIEGSVVLHTNTTNMT
jgi:hypothetical protein